VDAASVLAFARERLAQYKCPREIIVVEALPRTPNGKVKRSELGKAHRAQD
jgi:acyl-CoA synthetase (AMP-forming)/AMP-acid ligase II